MDLLKQTKQLCIEYGIKPVRNKGQNFLIKENIYDQIVETADLNKDDVVLEVGPGLGFLTEKLARKAKKVIAVELDDKLVNILEERMKEQEIENVEVVNEDILKIQITNSKLQINSKIKIPNGYKIVANLPYNITSIFLRKILAPKTYKLKPKILTLMLQKEVAERIVSRPGKMSKLAVSVQFYADAEIIDYVSKENFWPQPKVDSAIISIIPHKKSPLFLISPPPACPPKPWRRRGSERGSGGEGRGGRGERDFFQLVKYGFSAKRKMLKNNLAAGYQIKPTEAVKLLKKADFRENIRAQELSVKDWLRLFGKIH